HFVWQRRVVFPQDAIHRAGRIENDPLGPGFVAHPHKAFEHMTKRPMPYIMKKRSTTGGKTEAGSYGLLFLQLIQYTRSHPHGSQRMAESAMLRPLVGQVGQAHLSD